MEKGPSSHIFEGLPKERWEEYKQLKLKSVREELSAFSESEEELMQLTDEEWQEKIETVSSESKLFFSEVEGHLAGMGTLKIYSSERMKHNAYLGGLYVDPAYRGKGIGTQLTEARIDSALENSDIKNIFCHIVDTQVESLKLHERLGFEIAGTIKDEIQVEGTFYTSLLLQKQI